MKWVLIAILHTFNLAQGGITTLQVDFTSEAACNQAKKEIVGYLSSYQKQADSIRGQPVPGRPGAFYGEDIAYLRGKAFCVPK